MSAYWNTEAKRWYLEDRRIHAGDFIQLRGVVERIDGNDDPITEPGHWMSVRIESRDCGHELDAIVTVAGIVFKRHVAGFTLDGEPWVWNPFEGESSMRWRPDGPRDLSPADRAIDERNHLLQAALMMLTDGPTWGGAIRHPGGYEDRVRLIEAIKKLPPWRGEGAT